MRIHTDLQDTHTHTYTHTHTHTHTHTYTHIHTHTYTHIHTHTHTHCCTTMASSLLGSSLRRVTHSCSHASNSPLPRWRWARARRAWGGGQEHQHMVTWFAVKCIHTCIWQGCTHNHTITITAHTTTPSLLTQPHHHCTQPYHHCSQPHHHCSQPYHHCSHNHTPSLLTTTHPALMNHGGLTLEWLSLCRRASL